MNKHRVMTRIKYMPKHWGMHGFNRHPSLRNVNSTVNVGELESLANGNDTVNLTEMGIDKLLGSGKISQSLTVIVQEASARAAEKVSAAGGTVETEGDDDWGEWEEE